MKNDSNNFSEIDIDKELYLVEGLQYIPKILELMDRNKISETYGSFDRAFWHYRTSDFSSGMYQEAVLPLALAYTIKHPSNRFYQKESVRELIIAGIKFARKSSYNEGSCDDYFPFERATGAAAFSLYACTEALLVLGVNSAEFNDFFKLRGNYLANIGYAESGVLSNHKALIVLALYNVFLVTNDESFKKMAQEKLGHLLSLQTEEGWFPEYEGCDPGYLTFTIDFLAKYYQKSNDESVLTPLCRAVEFASYFMHPDGSYGGEYGSRNTFHFMPHGFEIMANLSSFSLPLTNSFLKSLKNKTRSYLDDDRIFIHYTYNYLQSYKDFYSPRESNCEQSIGGGAVYFKDAKLFVKRRGNDAIIISASKGGVCKIFKNGKLSYSDCGFVGKTTQDVKFISQVISDSKVYFDDKTFTIEGSCYEHKDIVLTPYVSLLFRIFLLFFARFLPANFVRKILQKKAIVKKKRVVSIKYRKTFDLNSFSTIQYELSLEDSKIQIRDLWIGADPTFIYIATSQPFQPGSLLPWIDLSHLVNDLNKNRKATFEYKLV